MTNYTGLRHKDCYKRLYNFTETHAVCSKPRNGVPARSNHAAHIRAPLWISRNANGNVALLNSISRPL